MSNLENISSWKVQLAEYEKAHGGNRIIPNSVFMSRDTPRPKILPYSVPAEIAEAILGNDELRQAYIDTEAWMIFEEEAGIYNDEDPRLEGKPWHLFKMKRDFIDWCIIQIDNPVEKYRLLGCVSTLVHGVLKGRFESVWSDEAREKIKNCVYGSFFGDVQHD